MTTDWTKQRQTVQMIRIEMKHVRNEYSPYNTGYLQRSKYQVDTLTYDILMVHPLHALDANGKCLPNVL